MRAYPELHRVPNLGRKYPRIADDAGIVSWLWTGPAGGTWATTATFTRTFSAATTANVTLKVTDSGGLANSITRSVVVTGGGVNQPPAAQFTVTCSPGKCVLNPCSSTDDHGIASYSWKTSVSSRPTKTGAQITRSWSSGGGNTYQETLTVTDGGALKNSVTKQITIRRP